jgi:hypothetical protein
MADSSGRVWTHTDATWLKRWVAQRNQAVSAASASARQPQSPAAYWASPFTDSCGPGG